MKIQFLVVCVMSSVVVYGQKYGGFQKQNHFVPIIRDGVPLDTPEVQAAKAAHFEAYARAETLAGKNPSDGQYYADDDQNNVIYDGGQQKYSFAAFSSDIPYDTPEVQRAKSAHYASVVQAQNRPQYRYRRYAIEHDAAATPEDTLEVKAAKYVHHLAHASAHDKNVDEEYPSYPQEHYHFPIITRQGVPVNTPEVKLARQQHLLAHHLAQSGVTYSGGLSDHSPVINPNGVPFDTPDVQNARRQHLVKYAEEAINNLEWSHKHF